MNDTALKNLGVDVSINVNLGKDDSSAADH